MNRLQTYYLIGSILSVDYPNQHKHNIKTLFESSKMDWELFIKVGSNHLVLQTLFSRLCKLNLIGYLPEEIRQHLEHIYKLNKERNTAILNQAAELTGILNDKGIQPLFLKGVGNLLDQVYTDIAERLMLDIDLLIPDSQWESAASVLLDCGYHAKFKYDKKNKEDLKHYPPLIKPGLRASVELHRLVLDPDFSKLLPPIVAWQNKKSLDHGGKCYVLSDQHKTTLNFAHSQLVHKGQAYAKALLRNLYELQCLSQRFNTLEQLSRIPIYRTQARNYLGLVNSAFGVHETGTKRTGIQSTIFKWRYELNLRSKTISLTNFFLSIFFQTYIILPIKSLRNKKLRKSLLNKLFERDWYRRHYKSLTRVFINNASKNI